LAVRQPPKQGVSSSYLFILLDIAIFLGDNNDLEEADDDDDLIDEQEEIDHDQMEENKEDTAERVTSNLRQSNGNPSFVQPNNQGLEGFTGIVGIGFGGKKAGPVPSAGVKGKK